MGQDAEASTASRGRRALEESVNALYDLLLRLAERSLVGRSDLSVDASDIVQLAYVAALEKPEFFAEGGREDVRQVLCGFVRIELLRARHRLTATAITRGGAFQGENFLRDAGLCSHDRTPCELAIAVERNERILTAFERLPPVERAVLVLVFIEGMSVEEAAEYLHLRQETAAKCRQRAVKKLRALLHDVLGRS